MSLKTASITMLCVLTVQSLIRQDVSPNVAYELFKKYMGEDCLQPVDSKVIHALMEELGGKDLILFVSHEYATKASVICDTLGLCDLNLQNAWHVFSAMLPLIRAAQ